MKRPPSAVRPKKPAAAKAAAKAAKPAATRSARANALVDAGRRAEDARAKRGRALIADIKQRLHAVGDEFVAIGRALKTVYDDELHRPLGYDTFDALLAGEALGSRAQAYKLMAVAAVFAQVGIEDLGIERAAALIAYTRATPEADDAAELWSANAVVGGKPVRDSSVSELERARREVVAQSPTATASAAAKARAALVKTALRRVSSGLKAGKLPSAEVTVRGRQVVASWSLDALAPAAE